ncbi:MAG TPA: DNA oxidative demethylase AlkB [Hypericibacter adhaerens]|uniref:Alpha-ketoglutarate-dependent dioxygenase AlkB n=1 Tax=Hypericibacter adhaerens TaxID=2602016 RepID=A0A5J6N6J9_9PROT|nr:DNA oxidative demethylase AlkB [Hypericibacter adhaerens]QEX25187.1 alpha-ketoglutarate-dependent dioxygenase AlkB [Hypericibacter adhaerens]HWA44843.1 DNA oxidative demethylase AlkB [Hypericibacter adhaerens]
MKHSRLALADLFAGAPPPRQGSVRPLAPGAALLQGFVHASLPALLQAIEHVAQQAPFRRMVTPGGHAMSVAMTNCGTVGWVTDRAGYRYSQTDPQTGLAWPPLPPIFVALAVGAAKAAGFPGFEPDACLVNRYEPGTKLSLHQDKDERDFSQPIVSVSLGLPAVFLFGGEQRNRKPMRLRLESGDVVVWGGPARHRYHGVDLLAEGSDPLAGPYRYNLTLRKAL